MDIREAKSDDSIQACWPPLVSLCPDLKKSETLLKLRQHIDKEGYRMIYIPAPGDETKATSFLGFRTLNKLFSGKTLIVDMVSTVPSARRMGQAGALLDWIIQYAKTNGFDSVMLDTGFEWTDSHRLYLNKGFILNSHHFMILGVQGKSNI